MAEQDWTAGWDFESWRHRVVRELVPMIDESAFTMSLLPRGEVDVKFAVELGVSIMLDKPIIALVVPGVRVPEHLVRVADRIVEVDFDGDPARAAAAINAAMQELTAELGLGEGEGS